ncbi:ParB/RepB/Spo0J family partition protein [Planktomarina temperata]|nr:ParB/RepB/Spo0J family partition protein [Planktomarina temperata]MDB2460408.1 ParB/RepB/Spo0J family partition protein [Planktomarina temperata]MDC0639354.1 ParB/RepB/Spo0J family partition protein [Planktomarina temperata]
MANTPKRQRGLGRGLSALMADIEPAVGGSGPIGSDRRNDMLVPIENINPNPDQPRRHFDVDDLNDLAGSIRSKGIIQPLVVRAHPGKTGEYEIVAGERRWRASQLAQLHELPVVVREFSDQDVLEIAIIENIQRADLNPIEEAIGYRQLMDKFGHTQEQMAEALGKSRPHIANVLRLLALPEDVQSLVVNGSLSSGHARALITAPNASDLARVVVARGLSVRQTEKLVKEPKTSGKERVSKSVKDADTRALEGDLSAALEMVVSITHNPGQEGGSITVRYKNLEQLDELCRHLAGL